MHARGLTAACTIVSPNYLPFARTLAQSYLRQHPDSDFFVLVVARRFDEEPIAGEKFKIVKLDEIVPGNLQQLAMKYDILELNTNVKPSFLKYIFRISNVESILYFDPDIYVYQPLDPIFQLLDSATVVLTPHITSPINDSGFLRERELLAVGTYNLGFIAFKRSGEGYRMLDWWERRCLEEGFNEIRTGLFVDQKWINLVPALFDGVIVCKDPGCNMAYWNLHERHLETDNNRYVVNRRHPLRFFHFSGIDVDSSEQLSKYTTTYTLASRPDLADVYAEYRAEVKANRNAATDLVPYGFDTFSNGRRITALARRIYARSWISFGGNDPFDHAGAFYRFAQEIDIVPDNEGGSRVSWKDYRPTDRRVLYLHRILRMTLYIIGPARYELLMRYLSHISVLREQAVIFGKRTD
jgi:hypothetical protein